MSSRPGAGEEQESEEEDFMSDSFLKQAEEATKKQSKQLSYSERRRKELAEASARGRIKSRAEREKEAREEGLKRNLLDERSAAMAGDGGASSSGASRSNKALSMMRAMGYKQGESLGQRKTKEEQAVASTTSKAQPKGSALPIDIDERWQGRVKYGIGSSAVSRAISQAAAAEKADPSLPSSELTDYRSRIASEQKLKHAEALLGRARKTCEELDRKELKLEYSPLWIDPHWLTANWDEQLDENQRLILRGAFGSELEDALGREGSDLAKREQQVKRALQGGEERTDEDTQEDLPLTTERAGEAKAFCALDAPKRLAITLDHLRDAHFYCLYCGYQYEDKEDLDKSCPGTEEDDHD